MCIHVAKGDPGTDTSPSGMYPQICKHTRSLLFLLLHPSLRTHIYMNIPVQRCAHIKYIPAHIYSHTLTCTPSLLHSSAHPHGTPGLASPRVGIGQLVSTLCCYNCLQESIRALFDIIPSVQPVSTQTMPWPCLTPCPSSQGSSPATVVPRCPQQRPCLVVFLPVFLVWACFCAARVHRNPWGSTNSCTNPHQCAGASRCHHQPKQERGTAQTIKTP